MKRLPWSYAIFALFCLSVVTVPTHAANAYVTTEQKVVAIGQESHVFLISYRFGHKNHELHMPIRAVSGTSTETNTLSYIVTNARGERVTNNTMGIVLSDAQITPGGMYVTEKNKYTNFTLAVLLPHTATKDEEYRLEVKHLPFSFDGAQQLQLNPSELQYYVTPYTKK